MNFKTNTINFQHNTKNLTIFYKILHKNLNSLKVNNNNLIKIKIKKMKNLKNLKINNNFFKKIKMNTKISKINFNKS